MALLQGVEIYIPPEAEVKSVPLLSLSSSVRRKMGLSAGMEALPDSPLCVWICPALFKLEGKKEEPQGRAGARLQVQNMLGSSRAACPSLDKGYGQCSMTFVSAHSMAYRLLKETLPQDPNTQLCSSPTLPQGVLSRTEQDAVIIHQGRVYLSLKTSKQKSRAHSSDTATGTGPVAPVNHNTRKRKYSLSEATEEPQPRPSSCGPPGASVGAGHSPGASVGAGHSPGASVGAGHSPGASVGAGHSPGASVGAGHSPGASVGPGHSPGASVGPGQSHGASVGAGHSQGAGVGAGVGAAHSQKASVGASVGAAHSQKASVGASVGAAHSQRASVGAAHSQRASVGAAHSQRASVGAAHSQRASVGAAHSQRASVGAAHSQRASVGAGHSHWASVGARRDEEVPEESSDHGPSLARYSAQQSHTESWGPSELFARHSLGPSKPDIDFKELASRERIALMEAKLQQRGPACSDL